MDEHQTTAGAAPTATVRDALRGPPTVVEPRAHLAAAAYLLKRSGDTALLVVSDDDKRTPVGLITDADVSQAVADGRDLEMVHVSEVVRGREPVIVDPRTSVDAALRLMLETGQHHLVAVGEGATAGIAAMADLCRSLFSMADGRTAAG